MNDNLVNQYNSLEKEPYKSCCWGRVEQVQHPRKDAGGEQVILGGKRERRPER